jgi:hypothetical protein
LIARCLYIHIPTTVEQLNTQWQGKARQTPYTKRIFPTAPEQYVRHDGFAVHQKHHRNHG